MTTQQQMSDGSTISAGARVSLRGYERLFTMADDGSLKIAHIMVLHGSADAIAAFLEHLPQAVVLSFNRHPRMRAMQAKDEFATVEIQPPVTLDTVSERKLLEIEEIAGREGEESERWEKYVDVQCNLPFDRYSQLPFFVRVWHYPDQNRVRLMLFSDHYMSDGISGLTALNDIVTFAATLSKDIKCASSELPLPPSLYELWLVPTTWRMWLSNWAVWLVGTAIFRSEQKAFKPVIRPRGDQSDFAVPVKVNSSSALFAQGTPANMQKTLRRCKEERVTFFGALAASTVLAYYVGSSQDIRKKQATSPSAAEPFKVTLEVDFNMRDRVPSPLEETPVGAYLATSALESLGKKGVNFDSTRFWDFARRCKQELDDTLVSVFMPLTLLFLDQNIHSEIIPDFPSRIDVPYCISSDVNISNVGKYPHKTKHAIQTAASTVEDLAIGSVHVYNSSPHLGSAAILYVMSTDQFNYSMMHKYESENAEKVFAAYAACIERAGEITSGETMAQVADRVAKLCRT
ncbi:hypothetical protein Gpo141_00011458 [Globisporangium polare]